MTEKHVMTLNYISAGRVLRRLADIESEGAQFYEGMMHGTKSEKVRQLATMLFKAEKRHRKRFLEYAVSAEKRAADEDAAEQKLPAEVEHLFKACIFVSKQRIEVSAEHAQDLDMIKLAIRAEESVALLLTQLSSFVPRAQRAYIVRVVDEEWGHKRKLESLLQKHFV